VEVNRITAMYTREGLKQRARKAIHQCFIIKPLNSIQHMSCSIQLFTDAEEFFVQFSSRWSFRRKPADFPNVYRKLRTKFIIIGIYGGVSDRIFKKKSKTRQVSWLLMPFPTLIQILQLRVYFYTFLLSQQTQPFKNWFRRKSQGFPFNLVCL